MTEEQNKEIPVNTSQPGIKEEDKINLIKKIIKCATSVMKIAFSKGDANTVWYKKGLYYTLACVLAAIVYIFTYHGVEVIDWAASLISNLF